MKRNGKGKLIGILCIALVFMGIGFAALQTNLNITGTATSSGTFDVKITNVEVDNSKTTAGVTDNTPPPGNNYAVTEQTLIATFSEPGDYITYDITVTNRGSIAAAITVETNPQVNTSGAFKLQCNAREGTTLAANGGNTTFQCRMSFDEGFNLESIENISQASMTVSIKAVQSSEYEAPSFEIPDYIISNDGVLLYSNIKTATVTVPDSFEGKTITAIGSYAFGNASDDVLGLIAMDMNDEENPVLKVFPFSELSNEILEMLEDEGGEIVTYEEFLDISYDFDDIDMSGGPAIIPLTMNTPSSNLRHLDLSLMTHLVDIHPAAFSQVGLQSVVFPTNGVLSRIGVEAFGGNALTGTLTIPSSVTVIDNNAFRGESDGSANQIESITFQGNNLTTIGLSAFRYNNLSGELIIPSSVETIGDWAFSGSENNNVTNHLTSVVFSGNNLNTIGYNAFSYNAITSMPTLPSSAVNVSANAFSNNPISN